jgi:hypothetical protein
MKENIITPPPPPSNPNWHRFANNVIGCKSLVDSYFAAGFHCSKATAYVNASKLRRKPVVDEYIQYWTQLQSQQYQQRQDALWAREFDDTLRRLGLRNR